MKLVNEINILYKIYNTLSLIMTKGQDTLYMANCINALKEVIESLENQDVKEEIFEFPLESIPEEKE